MLKGAQFHCFKIHCELDTLIFTNKNQYKGVEINSSYRKKHDVFINAFISVSFEGEMRGGEGKEGRREGGREGGRELRERPCNL